MANTRRFPTPDAQHVSHLLSSYLDGQVEEGERVLVERHLATCPVCRLELEQLQLIVNTMRATPLAEPTRSFALTPDMVRRRSWLSLWTRYSPAVAAIAAMLLVALLSVDLLLVQGFRGAPVPKASTAGAVALPQLAPSEPVTVLEAEPADRLRPEATAVPAPPLPPEPTVAAAAAELPAEPAPESAPLAASESPVEEAAPYSSAEAEVAGLAAAPLPAGSPALTNTYEPSKRGLGGPPPEATATPAAAFGLAVPPTPEDLAAAAEPLAAEGAPEDVTAQPRHEAPQIAVEERQDTQPADSAAEAHEQGMAEGAPEAQVRTEGRPLERTLRIAEVGLAAILAVSLATWALAIGLRRRSAHV